MSVRVALLTPCFGPKVGGAGERFVYELAHALFARGHGPRVITSHPGPPGRVVEDRLPITRHWRPPTKRLDARCFEQHLTHVPFSYASLRLGQDDVAQAVYITDALAAARWTRKTGQPSILSYMGIPDHPGLVGRRLRLEATARAAGECSATVALSETAADAFWRWLGIEARVIRPGVDIETFSPDGLRAERPTVFCGAQVGESRKRAEVVIEAMGLVRREWPDARLVLSCARDPFVAASLKSAGVEFADAYDRTSLAHAYSDAWVFVPPSSGEALGVVLAEALACGTPVVGENLPGIREIVDSDRIGRFFDGGAAKVARALVEGLELSNDPATESACRDRAKAFSIAHTAEAYEGLYRELLD